MPEECWCAAVAAVDYCLVVDAIATWVPLDVAFEREVEVEWETKAETLQRFDQYPRECPPRQWPRLPVSIAGDLYSLVVVVVVVEAGAKVQVAKVPTFARERFRVACWRVVAP